MREFLLKPVHLAPLSIQVHGLTSRIGIHGIINIASAESVAYVLSECLATGK